MIRVTDRWRRLVLMTVLLPLTIVSSGAQGTPGAPIRLAWDANAEPVAGYKVHVGTRTRQYVQVVDVRKQTTFSYEPTVRGQRYYFAVSAYLADGTESPLSSEVSGTAGTSPTTPLPIEPDIPDEQTSSRLKPDNSSQGIAATCADGVNCYHVRVQATGLDSISALSVASDGTVFLVERGARVRVLREQAAVAALSLIGAAGSRITDVVADADFTSSHHIYLGLTRYDGEAADFSVVRYRLVGERLSEAATVVSGLSAGSGNPRLAMDQSGRLYVAIPAERRSTPSDLYASKILRFNRDGTVPDDSRAASPILANGFQHPGSLDLRGRYLWATGVDDRWPHTLMYLELDASADDRWPRLLEPAFTLNRAAASPATSTNDDVTAYIDAARRLYILQASAGVQRPVVLSDSRGVLLPEAAIGTVAGEVYVAARDSDGSSSLLRLISPD